MFSRGRLAGGGKHRSGFRWEGSEDGSEEEGGDTGQEGEWGKAMPRLDEARGRGPGWLCWHQVKSVEGLLGARHSVIDWVYSCSVLTTTLTVSFLFVFPEESVETQRAAPFPVAHLVAGFA